MPPSSRFPRLGDHHFGVEVPFTSSDPTEMAHFQAIGRAQGVDVPKALIALTCYQLHTSACAALLRHGVPELKLKNPAAVLRYAREHFDPDSEPCSAATLLVCVGNLQEMSDPAALWGALRVLHILTLHFERCREFLDGPDLARERDAATHRSEGGSVTSHSRKRAARSLDKRLLEHFETEERRELERDPEGKLSFREYSKRHASMWSLAPETVRKRLGRMLSNRPTP